MTIEILMPALSPTMTDGNLTKWLIKKGDKVNSGDIIAEIETDKATMEIETVDEGIIKELLFKEGTEGIKVNTPIAIIEDVSSKNKSNKIEKKLDNQNIENNEKDKSLDNNKLDNIKKIILIYQCVKQLGMELEKK